MKFYLATGGPVIKNSVLFLLLLFSFHKAMAEIPIERNFLSLPDGRWIWLKKSGLHETTVILGKGSKSIRNKIWSQTYDSDGRRHTWSYAFFVRLKPNQFIVPDASGSPTVAISTYDMGNGMVRWAIIYRVGKDHLDVIAEKDGFNIAADKSIFDMESTPRNLNPHFNISDIKKWMGKYPFETIDGAELFSLKAVNDHLAGALGEEKYKEFLLIEDTGPKTPLELHNGVIRFTVCQKHNCDHMFYFFYDVKRERFLVCERELNPRRATWHDEKQKRVFSNQGCEISVDTLE